jgi:hypothetical protein
MGCRHVVGGLLGVTAIGCGGSDELAYYEPRAAESRQIPQSRIDSDAELAGRDPGRSVGVFIEYQSGGHFHIDLSCDTLLTGYGCSWFVLAEPGKGTPFGITLHDLESSDGFEVLERSVALWTYTNDDLDGISFRTMPGAALRLSVRLDEIPESRYVYWVGDGAVHTGAPTTPFDLVPSEP